MEKTYIKIDSKGNIISTFVGNDDKFVENNDVIDITKFNNKEKIVDNPNYFKFNDNKIDELSIKEKEKINKELSPPNQNSVYDLIKNISERLDKIEKSLKQK